MNKFYKLLIWLLVADRIKQLFTPRFRWKCDVCKAKVYGNDMLSFDNAVFKHEKAHREGVYG